MITSPHQLLRPNTIFGLGILLCIALLTGVARSAQPPVVGNANVPAILRVGIDKSAPPFTLVTKDGDTFGFCVDLLNAVAKDRGFQVEFVPLAWSDAIALFEAGKLDALANLTWLPARAGFADFAVPHAKTQGALFVRKGKPRVYTQEALRSMKIAVPRGSISHDYLIKRGLGDRLLLTIDLESSLATVERGEADATLLPRLSGNRAIAVGEFPHIEEAAVEFRDLSYSLHIAVRPGQTALLYEINLGLHNLRENGTYESLYAKWIGPVETLRRSWRNFRAHWLSFLLVTAALAAIFFVQRRLLLRLRRQAAALKISEERLTLVLEGSEDAFWDWDTRNGRVNRSERWAQILGCQPDELAPQIDAFRDITHPDDLDRIEQSKRQIMRDGKTRVEYRLRARDGTWHWIFDRGKVVARDDDGQPIRVTGAATDITLRKRIEAALVRSQALLEQTQLASGMGGWEYDLRSRTIFWTKETYRIHDLPPGDEPLPQDQVFDFCTQRSRDALAAAFVRAVDEAQEFDLELELVTAASRVIWVRCIGRVERAGEKVVRLFGSQQDITQRKKADEDRQKLQLKMLEAQKLESLGVLAGGIAHDFNNILTVIMGNASLARADLASMPDALEHIETAANRAADLCRQMLAYAGKSRFSLETQDLNAIVQDTTQLLRTSINKNAELEFALAADPLAVEIDASQIRQVIMNLVINASDAIGSATGRIRVSSARKPITAEQLRDARIGQESPPGDYVILEVEDDGCGMSPQTVSRIFDPFFTTKFTGRGLGLAAVLGIVRAHRGAFFVRSTLAKGTTFTLLLPPALKNIAARTRVVSTASPIEIKEDGTVLVVDDEPQVRKIAASILEKQGYSVAIAADGYEALALALAHGMRFKAVLLDLTMPGLDGPSTLRELRGLSKRVPVLIMSGYSETDARKHFAADPLIGFLPKPFAADDLLQKIKQLAQSVPPATEVTATKVDRPV